MKRDIILKTLHGSHAWGMNHVESDEDVFSVYAHPTREILRNDGAPSKSVRNYQQGADYDEIFHEAGHVVKMLQGGNINYIIGVMSPEVKYSTKEGEHLRKIMRDYPSKSVYNSAYGLAYSNYSKYILSGQDDTPKKRALIYRTLHFAQRLISDGVYDFITVDPADVDIAVLAKAFADLKRAHDESTLRPKMSQDLLKDWLLELRLNHL